jgi:serine/threonine protein kinase
MLPIEPDTLLQQRYRILNLLGEGKFGRTYLATDRGRADAYCAIEELAPFSQFSSAVAKAKEIFKKEAALLYQLQHPQIPRFWTTVEEDSRLLLVRDYVVGRTYQDLLEDRRNVGRTFSESEVYQFLLELLPVIGYIHDQGTIHRDITPAHIVCRDGDRLPVPIDFGVVKEFANKLQESPASPRKAIGQAGYAPIEQIQQGQIYPNSDLYALAVTAIVLLTGKEPSALFTGDRINWEWRKWTDIDNGLADILGRMLSLQPNDRYQSALEVDRDLRALNLPIDHQVEPDHETFDPLLPVNIPAVDDQNRFSVVDHVQTAITNLNVKSIWERPQVFIPVGILISLLAGVGSWFGVTQLLNRPTAEPVATTPPKQIDFNNPTIPTNTGPALGTSDTLQLELDRPIEKEGKVEANTPIRYTITAIAGENLDIQLMPLTAKNIDPSKPLPTIDPTLPVTTPSTSPSPSPGSSLGKNRKDKNIPTPLSTPTPTQVLMTIISPTGGPIDDKADRIVGWRGQLTSSGDYTIELRPITGLTGAFPYKLSVTKSAQPPISNPTSPADPATPNPLGGNAAPPLGVPIPIGGTGIKSIPTVPSPAIPSNDLPTFSPEPIPNAVPVSPPESAPPARKKKRRNVESEQSTPRVKRERTNTDTSEETPRVRRRRRVVDSTETETSTPRQRRNRRSNSEDQPKPNPLPRNIPDSDNSETNNPPQKEEQIPILVPEAKKVTPPAAKPEGTKPEGGNKPEGTKPEGTKPEQIPSNLIDTE